MRTANKTSAMADISALRRNPLLCFCVMGLHRILGPSCNEMSILCSRFVNALGEKVSDLNKGVKYASFNYRMDYFY